MSVWEDLFGKDGTYEEYFFRPSMTTERAKLIQRAAALHPGADPSFNLQPTIDMLETADMYGFEVRRKV